MSCLFAVFSSAALCFQWIVLHASGVEVAPQWQAVSAGLAIIAASLTLSWCADLAQLDMPQALALLALVGVLPDHAAGAYFAWMAGKDPQQAAAFATTSMTGANRLLIGLAWPVAVFVFW